MTKSFDAVRWMREQRNRIDVETEGLSWLERRQWVRKSLEGDPLWESLKHRLTPPGDTPHSAENRR